MTHIMRVEAGMLINQTANQLKSQKLLQKPDWSQFVKTGHHKERLPDSEDWWFQRGAAILRSVAKMGPVGTQKLRHKFGGKKNNGHKKDHFYKASGSIIRKLLQQLETSELIKQEQKGNFKGRILTPKGTSFLDKIAVDIYKNSSSRPKKAAKTEAPKVEKQAEVAKEAPKTEAPEAKEAKESKAEAPAAPVEAETTTETPKAAEAPATETKTEESQ